MPHYVYEIPRGAAAIRQVSAFPDYPEASAFAREERARRDFHDQTMIAVVHAESFEAADIAARKLQADFETARQSRPAPTARVTQFVQSYPAEPPPQQRALPPG